MRRRRAGPGLAASGREEDDLLARALRRLPGPRERPAVAKVLAVDADHAGVLVRCERLDELGGLDVGLIAERGEARDADAVLCAEQAQLEREVATLGDHPERAWGELVHAEIERGCCVVDAEAVRPEHDRSRTAHLVDHPALELLAVVVDLAETGCDRDDPASAGSRRRRRRPRTPRQAPRSRRARAGRVAPRVSGTPAARGSRRRSDSRARRRGGRHRGARRRRSTDPTSPGRSTRRAPRASVDRRAAPDRAGGLRILRWESVSQDPQSRCSLPRCARIRKPGTYGSL